MIKAVYDKQLLKRYDTTSPRYTSYPTALQFSDSFTADDYVKCATDSNSYPIPAPLSLYFHIPFCNSICYYCGCNKVITNDQRKANNYVDLLLLEIEQQAKLFDNDRKVTQMHWGGGTPTFLNDKNIERILTRTRESFNLSAEEGEFNIEVDPRTVDPARISRLHEMGFNRISFGVQDFNKDVQKSVHREQDNDQVLKNISAARSHGFKSINLDLMYGLPKQTIHSFDETLDITIEASPDRIAVYNYAHLPELFKPQRRINEADIPAPALKLDLLQLTIEKLQASGYVYIGMDHFAKSSDNLVRAQNKETLHRNFQGYSTHAECDIVAMGITAISSIGDSYAQNVKTIEAYEQCLREDKIPVFRGIELEADDVLRKEIINKLMCNFELDIKKLEEKWEFNFMKHFSSVIPQLHQMAEDGLLDFNRDKIEVSATGRLLIRNICMAFDRYLQERREKNSYSRSI